MSETKDQEDQTADHPEPTPAHTTAQEPGPVRRQTQGYTRPAAQQQQAKPSIWPEKLPPAGPVWYPSVMGTGILANLIGRHVGDHAWLLAPATVLLVIAWILLIGLTVGFAIRSFRDITNFTVTWTNIAVLPMWGTVSMGILSAGAALQTIAPKLGAVSSPGSGLPASWVVATCVVTWILGTIVGVIATIWFTTLLFARHMQHPVPAWGLSLVGPMVSATTGAGITQVLDSTRWVVAVLFISTGCFFLSLIVGGLLFLLAYRHHFFAEPIPIDASLSAWIPLGVVGQSTAAAQSIVLQSHAILIPQAFPAAGWLGHAYGWFMIACAVPVVAFAVAMSVRGFTSGMKYTPGWWALTFPIGTLTLGTAMMSQTMGGPASSILGAVSWICLITLCCTWTFCAASTLFAIGRTRAQQA